MPWAVGRAIVVVRSLLTMWVVQTDSGHLRDGPIPAASAWLTAVLKDGALSQAWPLTTLALRFDLANKWLQEYPHRASGRDPERLCEGIAEAGPDHANWDEFAADVVAFLQRIWDYVDFEKWGWVDRTNPVGVDREIVALINVEGHFGELEENAQAEALPLVMELESGRWKVASLRRSDASEEELMGIDPRDL